MRNKDSETIITKIRRANILHTNEMAILFTPWVALFQNRLINMKEKIFLQSRNTSACFSLFQNI